MKRFPVFTSANLYENRSFTLKTVISLFYAVCLLSSLLVVGACATSRPLLKTEIAKRIASPAWMVGREIPAGKFLLTAYERIHDHNSAADLYIEGNGTTPRYPLALHLASKDKADNVIYLARPCQYSAMLDEDKPCDPKYTGQAQYSSEVIDAYNAALDEISKRYGIIGFNLIAYDGGAVIASALAAGRNDILSLRTVAGIMDTNAWSDVHGVPRAEEEQNPALKAVKLSGIPQYHFIGGQDKEVPPSVLHGYLQSLPPTRCVQYDLIQENEHKDGWVEKWPELLSRPVTCYNSSSPTLFNALDLIPEQPKKPVYPIVREKPAKP